MLTSTDSKRSPSARRRLLPPLAAIQAEKARRKLHNFVRYGWHVLEPEAPFIDNWHIGAICEHLEACSRGEIRRLIINVPPGHMKSLLVSVFWPAWEWIERPSLRWLLGSYGYDLSVRDNAKTRKLVESDWYRQLFAQELDGLSWSGTEDHLINSRTGERWAISVGGKTTGLRGDRIVVDDALNALDAYSEAARLRANRWWSKAMSNRTNNKRAVKVIIAQRLHEGDLPGELLEQGDWDHLMLPTEFEPDRRCHTSLGFKDPRTKPGELLNPEMFGPAEVKEGKRDLGSDGFSAQHQQRPTSAEGNMFKRAWFLRRWRRPGEPAIEGLETRVIDPKNHRWSQVIITLDCTFKKTLDSDFVCGGVWGYEPPDRFLLDIMWDRMTFSETLRNFLDLCNAWPKARLKIIEGAANGPAVIEVLKRKVSGIVEVDAMGGKESRAAAISPDVEAGNCWLPAWAPWVNAFIDELCQFPKGKKDDAVDMTSYALLRLSTSSQAERIKRLIRYK